MAVVYCKLPAPTPTGSSLQRGQKRGFCRANDGRGHQATRDPMIGFANNVAHQGKRRPETLECNIPVQRRSETYADLFPSTSAVRIKGYLQTESYLQVSYPVTRSQLIPSLSYDSGLGKAATGPSALTCDTRRKRLREFKTRPFQLAANRHLSFYDVHLMSPNRQPSDDRDEVESRVGL